jgi:hypothetical protein
MGLLLYRPGAAGVAIAGSLLLLLTSGCQIAPTIATGRLIEHQALMDFSGLKDQQQISVLKVIAAPPETWEPLPLERNALYAHLQWKSPSGDTGVGVAHVRMPLPLRPRTLLRFAKNEYRKQDGGGVIMAEWTDEFGRPWFEAENNRYYVRGYAVTSGFDGWIIYCGYKVTRPPNPAEINLAARCLESILPLPLRRYASAAN